MKYHQDIDYKNNVFEIPELTRIIGEPTTATLLELRNELRCNAQSVNTTLGGGQHGHLGLVTSDTLYASLPDTVPYERPAYPGPFVIQNEEATAVQIEQERADWEESTRLWREVNAVERALIQQIVAAVEPKYLKALRNHVTIKIKQDVRGILNYLFNNYGKIPPSTLKDMKRKVEDFQLDPRDPIDILFVEIDELADIYKLQNDELTQKQLIGMAYVTIERAKVFKKDLREWNRKNENLKTWSEFKKQFRVAQQELRTTGDLTVKDAMEKEDLVNIVTESINNVLEIRENNQENGPSEELNAVVREKDDLKQQLDTMKEQLANVMKMQQQQQPFNAWPQNQQNFQQPQFHPMFNPYQMQNQRRNNNNKRRNKNNYKYVGTGRYCWTHGACDHWGRNCRNKAEGHVDEADFNNTRGGCMKGVRT